MRKIAFALFLALTTTMLASCQAASNQLEASKEMNETVYLRDDLAKDDLALGSVKVGMQKEEIIRTMGEPIRVQSHPSGKEERMHYDGGMQIMLSNNTAFFIEALDAQYSTPRGLKVGDSKDRLIELYGEPSEITRDSSTGSSILSFDLSGEYYLFHAELKDNSIVRLQVNSAN